MAIIRAGKSDITRLIYLIKNRFGNVDNTADASKNVLTALKWKTARNINGLSIDGTTNRFDYSICSAPASASVKTVTCAGYLLSAGSQITIKFTVTNTAVNPTLNVNGTGAKAIYYHGTAIAAGYLAANHTYIFRYNGAQYELVGSINTDTLVAVAGTDIKE